MRVVVLCKEQIRSEKEMIEVLIGLSHSLHLIKKLMAFRLCLVIQPPWNPNELYPLAQFRPLVHVGVVNMAPFVTLSTINDF